MELDLKPLSSDQRREFYKRWADFTKTVEESADPGICHAIADSFGISGPFNEHGHKALFGILDSRGLVDPKVNGGTDLLLSVLEDHAGENARDDKAVKALEHFRSYCIKLFPFKNGTSPQEASGVVVGHLRRNHPQFTGRKDLVAPDGKLILELIPESHDFSKGATFAALCGDGGYGKTEAAIAFTNENKSHFSFVFVVSAVSESSLTDSYQNIAHEINVYIDKDLNTDTIIENVNKRLEQLGTTRPWLLLLDNLERSIVLPERGGAILVTSRQRRLWTSSGPVYDLGPLSDKESAKLLQSTTDESNWDVAVSMAKLLKGWPLLVSMVASLSVTLGSMEDLVKIVKTQERLEMLSTIELEPGNGIHQRRYHLDFIQDVWLLSRERLISDNQDGHTALEWIEICAHFASDPIPVTFLTSWLSKKHGLESGSLTLKVKGQKLLDILHGHSLIAFVDNPGYNQRQMFQIHDVKQDLIRTNIHQNDLQNRFDSACQVIGEAGLQLTSVSWCWTDARAWEPHGSKLHDEMTRGVTCGELMHAYVSYGLSVSRGLAADYNTSFRCAKEAVNIFESSKDYTEEDKAKCQTQLAVALLNNAKFRESKKILLEVLRTLRETKSTTTDLKVRVLEQLGEVCVCQGLYRSAKLYYMKTLSLKRAAHGEDASIAATLHKLGSVCFNEGQDAEARQYYEESLSMKQALYRRGSNHPDTAATLHALAGVCSGEGQDAQARRYYEQSLAMKQALYGDKSNHPEIADTFHSLGSVYRNAGQYVEARQQYEKSLAMKRAIYGADSNHPSIAATLHSLGSVCYNEGQNREARQYYEQSLAMKRATYGADSNHPSIADTLHSLGNVCYCEGHCAQAKQHYTQSLAMKRATYGASSNHPSIADTLHQLGSVYCRKGRYAEARQYYEQSLAMKRATHAAGSNYPSIAATLHALGKVYRKEKRYVEARCYYKQSLALHFQSMRRTKHEADSGHPSFPNAVPPLGDVFCTEGQDHHSIKATPCYKHGLATRQATLRLLAH